MGRGNSGTRGGRPANSRGAETATEKGPKTTSAEARGLYQIAAQQVDMSFYVTERGGRGAAESFKANTEAMDKFTNSLARLDTKTLQDQHKLYEGLRVDLQNGTGPYKELAQRNPNMLNAFKKSYAWKSASIKKALKSRGVTV